MPITISNRDVNSTFFKVKTSKIFKTQTFTRRQAVSSFCQRQLQTMQLAKQSNEVKSLNQ